MAKKQKKPADSVPATRNEGVDEDNLITLTDDEGVDHEFEVLELFNVGQGKYALLHPVESTDDVATILKFTLTKDGNEIDEFLDPTDEEFDAAVAYLESDEEEEPAPKKAAKKPAAKPAAKKPAAKPKKS